MRPMAFQRPWILRSAALRRCALSLEKTISTGLKSGLYGGRNMSSAAAASIAAGTAGALGSTDCL
jgi:hypothetical protein